MSSGIPLRIIESQEPLRCETPDGGMFTGTMKIPNLSGILNSIWIVPQSDCRKLRHLTVRLNAGMVLYACSRPRTIRSLFGAGDGYKIDFALSSGNEGGLDMARLASVDITVATRFPAIFSITQGLYSPW